MRVAVVGATGNIGFHLVHALLARRDTEEVVAVARRLPEESIDPRVRWCSVDVSRPGAEQDLADVFVGCDAVVHLAWQIQPERAANLLQATNVDGSRRVFDAVAAAGVPALVYASSVGVYSPGGKGAPPRSRDVPPGGKDAPVDETWSTAGVRTSLYSRHKVTVERMLDGFELGHPPIRVVRMRPAFVLSGAVAASQVRYFIGPLLPWLLLRSGRLPLIPRICGIEVQLVHSQDAAAAFAAAVARPTRGAFNIAAQPVIGPETLPSILGGRPVPVPVGLVRVLVRLAYLLRLTPFSPGWIDLASAVPIMDTGRARRELRWQPRHSAASALREWVGSLAHGSGRRTPILRAAPRWVDQVRGGTRALTRLSGGRS